MVERILFPGTRRLKLVDENGEMTTVWAEFFRKIAVRLELTFFGSTALGSYPTDLTITSRASDASIQISAHSRVYPGGNKTVQAGSVLSRIYATQYYIYYDDAQREGGLVVYAATTTRTDAFASATYPNRHYVGRVTMPATAAAANTTGTPATPPGYS